MPTSPHEAPKSPPNAGSVPVPDPTTLTNELVAAAVTAAVQRLEARMDGADKLQAEKFNALEARIVANREAVEDRFKLEGEAKVKAAADVKSAVDAAFAAAASGVAQQNQANFLASQKQENAFTKQIDQLAASVAQISKANDDKLSDLKKTNDDKFGDLKDRIVAMEGRSSISDPAMASAMRDMANVIGTLKTASDQGTGRNEQGSASIALMISIIAAVAAVGIVLVDWIGFATRGHS
jgi:hypothetical protein